MDKSTGTKPDLRRESSTRRLAQKERLRNDPAPDGSHPLEIDLAKTDEVLPSTGCDRHESAEVFTTRHCARWVNPVNQDFYHPTARRLSPNPVPVVSLMVSVARR